MGVSLSTCFTGCWFPTIFMEDCSSGLRSLFAKQVYESTVGSNPTSSAKAGEPGDPALLTQ